MLNEKRHYLRKELETLFAKDTSIFRFLREATLDGIWYWDLEAPENEWMSARFWTILGYNPSEKKHLSSEWKDLIYPEDLPATIDNFKKHCEDPNHPYDQVVRYKHMNGSTVWIRCRGIAIRDGNGKAIRMLGAHTDLTKQKEAEAQLREHRDHLEALVSKRTEALHVLAGHVLFAQEEERSRLARELHDDFSQRLVALIFQVERLEQTTLSSSGKVGTQVREIKNQVQKLSTDLHGITRQLHPAILDDLGLAAAIKSECDHFSSREKIQIKYTSNCLPSDIPVKVALCLYRVVQEGLRNVAKHARARDVDLRLTGSSSEIVLLMKDSGIGFDPNQTSGKGGLGLFSMKERVHLIQGELSIQSQKNHGTVIEVRIPFLERDG